MLVKLLLFTALVSAPPAPEAIPLRVHKLDTDTYVPIQLPPPVYQTLDPVSTKIFFYQNPNIVPPNLKCGNYGVIGCTQRNRGTDYDPEAHIILPNPCQYPDDDYARLVCHELGHVRGWDHDKP